MNRTSQRIVVAAAVVGALMLPLSSGANWWGWTYVPDGFAYRYNTFVPFNQGGNNSWQYMYWGYPPQGYGSFYYFAWPYVPPTYQYYWFTP